MRRIKIVGSEFRKRTLPEFFRMLIKGLFAFEKVVIVYRDINKNVITDIDCIYNNRVVKGSLERLDEIRSKLSSPPWEFSCHIYDGVKDFFVFEDDNGSIRHITWIYYSGDPNKDIRLGDREVELKYGYTHRDYRGKHLLPASLDAMNAYLLEQGYERMLATILNTNKASLKAVERAGFRKIKEKYSIRLFGFVVTPRYSYN